MGEWRIATLELVHNSITVQLHSCLHSISTTRLRAVHLLFLFYRWEFRRWKAWAFTQNLLQLSLDGVPDKLMGRKGCNEAGLAVSGRKKASLAGKNLAQNPLQWQSTKSFFVTTSGNWDSFLLSLSCLGPYHLHLCLEKLFFPRLKKGEGVTATSGH